MKYMGSKNRYAKELLPIILENHTEDMWYIEPFVGGGNMIDKVPFDKRIGCDSNKYIIALLNSISKRNFSFMEPYVDKEEYNNVRSNKGNFKDDYVGWVAHGCSYNGKWFGGHAGKILTKIGTERNYQEECRKSLIKQSPNLQGVKLLHKSVFDIGHIKGKATIYCDPPYEGTTKYKDDFDHERFWDWCRFQQGEGHNVFISEYNAPDDFICLWEKEVNSSLTKDTGSKKGVEKLFTLKNNS